MLCDLLLQTVGQLAAGGHVGAAGVGRDREARRHRDAERRHLGKADPLATEELAPTAGVLFEVVDVAHRPGIYTRPVSGHILAMGGGVLLDRNSKLEDFMLGLAGSSRPRVCFVPTAGGEKPEWIVRFYEVFAARDCEPSHLTLFGMPEIPPSTWLGRT